MSSERPHSYKSILLYQIEQVIENVKEYDKAIKNRVTLAATKVHDTVDSLPNPFWELLELFSDVEIFDLADKMEMWTGSPIDEYDCQIVEEVAEEITGWLNAYINGLTVICNTRKPKTKENKIYQKETKDV